MNMATGTLSGGIMQRPTKSYYLSLIGGAFVLLVGGDRLVDLILFGSYGGPDTGFDAALDLGVGLMCGILMVTGAIMLSRRPQRHKMWGVLVLAVSLLSIIGTAGGLFIGLLLGLIGGIMAIHWKPSVMPS